MPIVFLMTTLLLLGIFDKGFLNPTLGIIIYSAVIVILSGGLIYYSCINTMRYNKSLKEREASLTAIFDAMNYSTLAPLAIKVVSG